MSQVGFLCYDLQDFTTDCLNRIQAKLPIVLKAYPIFSRFSSQPKTFHYRLSIQSGNFFSVRSKKALPEGFAKGIDWSIALACARENQVIVLFGLQGGTALATALLARVFGRKIISVNQTMAPEWEKKRVWWVKLLKKFLLNLCHFHIVQTKSTKRTLKDIYGLNPVFFYDAPFESGASSFEKVLIKAKPRTRKTSKKTNFLFVGTLLKLKGIPEIIEACVELKNKGFHFETRLVGPAGRQLGEYTLKDYQNLIKKKGLSSEIRVLGPCKFEDLPSFYFWADVLLLPTKKDVWPKVLVEASLSGLPSITTKVCGAAYDLVIPGDTGWIINPDNSIDLKDAMITALKDKTRLRKMGKNARTRCFELCNGEKETNGYVQAINAALKAIQHE